MTNLLVSNLLDFASVCPRSDLMLSRLRPMTEVSIYGANFDTIRITFGQRANHASTTCTVFFPSEAHPVQAHRQHAFREECSFQLSFPLVVMRYPGEPRPDLMSSCHKLLLVLQILQALPGLVKRETQSLRYIHSACAAVLVCDLDAEQFIAEQLEVETCECWRVWFEPSLIQNTLLWEDWGLHTAAAWRDSLLESIIHSRVLRRGCPHNHTNDRDFVS